MEEIKAAQKAEFEAEQKKLAGETETAEEAEESAIDIEPKAEIEYDDFMKMQFQVGEIIACEAVPKSKKLLCSQVKIGSQVKTDRFRYPQALHTGRDGWQKSHGISELKTGKTCRCSLRGYVTLRRG